MYSIQQLLTSYIYDAITEFNVKQIHCILKYNSLQVRQLKPCGQFQSPDLIALAHILNIDSNVFVETIANKITIKNYPVIESCFATIPGFINFNLKDTFLESYIQTSLNTNKKNQLIFLDFGGANIAKTLHIGHIRSMLLGEALRRLYIHCGYDVITDIHMGDWGTQMGIILFGIKEEFPDSSFFLKNLECYPKESPVSMEDLEILYPKYSLKCSNDVSALKVAKDFTFLLQNNMHGGIAALWKCILKISTDHIKSISDLLEVHFDLWKGESDVMYLIPQIIQNGADMGVIFKHEGALIIDTAPFNNMLIQKSDGSFLYTTTEIATIAERITNYNPKEIIYIVDKRQELHFSQAFLAAQKLKLVDGQKLTFLGFGTINDSQDKPYKTRSGESLNLQNVIKETMSYVRNPSEFNEHIALSSIKFSILASKYSANYKFDIKKFTQYEGKTALYILYTASRIKSIFLNMKNIHLLENYMQGPYSPIEKEIMLLLSLKADVLTNACSSKDTSLLCNYIYDLCNIFNKLYADVNFIKEENTVKKTKYFILCSLVLKDINTIAEILGMHIPEYV